MKGSPSVRASTRTANGVIALSQGTAEGIVLLSEIDCPPAPGLPRCRQMMESDALRTRPTLLLRMRDPQDQAAWEQFVDIYTPLIYGFCRQRGLQDADAADVSQDVMRTVARGAGRFEYDPARGKFRNWLLTVVRSKMANFFASRQRHPDPAGPTTLQQLAESNPLADEQSEWDNRYHRHIFQWACERIRPEFQESSWQAFWQTTVEDRDGKEVADKLNMTVGAVYVAKSRVLARLRQEIRLVEEEDIGGQPA